MRDEWATLAGALRLHLLRWPDTGKSPTFLLVHGLASNALLWSGVGPLLAAHGHEAVAVDLRGHGRSAKPDDGYDTMTVADDLVRLVEHLGLDRPVLVGQSWGGNVALEFAARHHSLVAGVACVDGGWIEPSARFPDWETCAARLAPPVLAGTPATAIERGLRTAHPDWPDAAIVATLGNFELRADGTVAPWLSRERHMRIVRDLWESHPPARYPDVLAPVLLLPVRHVGPALATDEEVAKAEALLPVARTTWLEGDHDVHAQRPAVVAALLLGAVEDGFFR